LGVQRGQFGTQTAAITPSASLLQVGVLTNVRRASDGQMVPVTIADRIQGFSDTSSVLRTLIAHEVAHAIMTEAGANAEHEAGSIMQSGQMRGVYVGGQGNAQLYQTYSDATREKLDLIRR